MLMTEYLRDTFDYNDSANRKLLATILTLPEKAEAVKLFSHLINCQYKWMARVNGDPKQTELDWWEPLREEHMLESEWGRSIALWKEYLSAHSDEEISREVQYIGYDGSLFAATPKDIAIQLNYHSIHHRAQIQTMIRKQGLTPDFLDYIGTKYRRVK